MICFICWVIDDDEGRKRGGRLSRNLGATTSATLINLFAIWYKEMLSTGTTTFASASVSESAWTARCHACTRSAEIFHNNVSHVRCLQHDNILIYTCDESVKNFTAHDAAAFDFWVCETLEKASEETFAASHVLLIHKINVEWNFLCCISLGRQRHGRGLVVMSCYAASRQHFITHWIQLHSLRTWPNRQRSHGIQQVVLFVIQILKAHMLRVER